MSRSARLLPWHSAQWRSLTERLGAGNLPHALLLTGMSGVGKRRFARLFAKAVLCEQPAEQHEPCGACRSCTLFEAGSHPDLVVVEPAEEGKDITIGQVRGLAAQVALKSQYGRHRVVVLDPADRMNPNAANALLKTLEEPGPDTLLLLVSDRPSALLPTIRSRCQQIAFRPPAKADALTWLATEIDAGDGAESLLALAGGAPLHAVELAREGGVTHYQSLLSDLEAVAAGADPVATAATWGEMALADMLALWYRLFAELIRLKSGAGGEEACFHDLRGRLQAMVDTVDLGGLFAQLDSSMRAQRFARNQVNHQLLLDELWIGWSETAARGTANNRRRI
jgi:DNA polymerase-3 subunit delta'